ncbi:MAG: GNAT family N-acetyltransferase [Planctomycetota bacterium]
MSGGVMRIEAVPIETILPLRTEVLRDGQPPESAQFPGDHDPATLHLAAIGTVDKPNVVVGCLSLMPNPMPEDPAWTHQLRGMAVVEELRGSGVGGQLLVELGRRTPGYRVWCNARVPAQRFYGRHGWSVVSEAFEVPHHGPHVRMCRGV